MTITTSLTATADLRLAAVEETTASVVALDREQFEFVAIALVLIVFLLALHVVAGFGRR